MVKFWIWMRKLKKNTLRTFSPIDSKLQLCLNIIPKKVLA